MRLLDGKDNLLKNKDMTALILESVSVAENLVKYNFSCSKELDHFFTTKTMFIEYEDSVEDIPLSILTIPFVNCMLGLVWMVDCELFVDEIDKTYYNSIKNLKTAYEELHNYPHLKGLFVPSKLVDNKIEKSEKSLLLFGGGIDCQSSYLRNSNKISYVLNIYGWLKDLEENNRVDISDKRQTETFALSMGVIPLHARSNFASQFCLAEIERKLTRKIGTSYWFAFLHSMAFISIATPVAWKKGISEIIIASSYTKGRANRHCGSFITTDSEFRFAKEGKVLHDGFELNRNDKVALIVKYQKQLNAPYNLQVCSFNECNCCVCEKCFRTIVDIISLGGNPKMFGFESYSQEHWEKIVNDNIALWGVEKEAYYYYHNTAKKMRENYERIEDKKFVDWFLSCDFVKMRRIALKKYYLKNFFSILRRKLRLK